MSDDTPTERFTPLTTPEGGGSPVHVPNEKPRSKTLIIVLSVIGGLLLIAVTVLLTLLFAGGKGEPTSAPTVSSSPTASPSASPSATPSETPSATPTTAPTTAPTPTPPPATTGPVFDSFSPSNNSSAGCASDSGQAIVTFTWTSTGANEAAIGVGTTDAFAGSYASGLPASGSYDLPYQCNVDSQIYTVSIRGVSGQTNKTITLKR